jgi:hypothetical protein
MCGAVSPYLSTGSTLPFFRDLLIAEDLLLCSLESPTGPYSVACDSIPRHHTLISLRSISVLFSHLRLGLKVVSSRRIFRLKFCTHFSSPRACYMAVNLFDLVTLIIIGKECKLWNSWLCSFLIAPITSFVLGPNILLTILFSCTIQTQYLTSSLIQTTNREHSPQRSYLLICSQISCLCVAWSMPLIRSANFLLWWGSINFVSWKLYAYWWCLQKFACGEQ